MNAITAVSIMALCCAECSGADEFQSNANLLPALQLYVREVVSELDKVSAERKVVLNAIVASINTQLETGKAARLTFICTHNSRRSHMSQIWAQTAACYYGLDN